MEDPKKNVNLESESEVIENFKNLQKELNLSVETHSDSDAGYIPLIEQDEKLPPIQGKIQDKRIYRSSVTAFTDALLIDGPLSALEKDYNADPVKKIDLLKSNWGTLSVALFVGGLAAYFYVPSAWNAGKLLAELLNVNSETGEVVMTIIKSFMVASGAGENLCLGAYSIKELIDHFGKYYWNLSDEEHHLINKANPTKKEIALRIGRIMFDAVFTIGSVIPAFFIGATDGPFNAGVNYLLAGLSSVANMPINWLSVQSIYLPRDLTLYEQSKGIIANYLNQQINSFLQLDKSTISHKFTSILDKTKDIEGEAKFFTVFFELLALSRDTSNITINKINSDENNNNPDNRYEVTQTDDDIAINFKQPYVQYIQHAPIESTNRWLFKYLSLGVLLPSSMGYVLDSLVGGTKAAGKGFGYLSAFLTVVPFTGLSYLAGKKVGEDLMSGSTTLADHVAPNAPRRIGYFIGGFSIFAGGTNAKANYENIILQTNSKAASVISGIDGAVAAGVINGHFTNALKDDSYITYGKYFGSDDVRRLTNFVAEVRKISALIDKMTIKSFREICIYLYQNKDTYPTFCNQFFAILQDKMQGSDYQALVDLIEHHMSGKDEHVMLINEESTDSNTKPSIWVDRKKYHGNFFPQAPGETESQDTKSETEPLLNNQPSSKVPQYTT